MATLICLVLFLVMTGHSSATYCLCRDGVSDQALQKTLDYACGAGADCTAILQNGACYNPNTVKDHCNYAVNSYFQRQGQATGSCDFSATASTSPNPPSNIPSTCSYPSSSTGTTSTTTPITGTTTGTNGTPAILGGGNSTLGPTGATTTGINDPSHAMALFRSTTNNIFFPLALWILGLSWI